MENFHQETVRENMSRPVRTVAPEMTLGDLLRLFSADDFAAYPVVRNETLVGTVSRADALRPFPAKAGGDVLDFDAIMGTTIEQIMSSRITKVELDATLEQAAQLMAAEASESLPVVDRQNRVRGIIARDDVIRALARDTWRSSLPLELRPMGYAIA